MAVTKLLGLLLTLQFTLNSVSSAGINSRQLDIPAFKAFFSQIQSHLVNDKDQGSTGTSAGSAKIEGLNPPPIASPDLMVNNSFVKNANHVPGNDSKFGANLLRDSESNRNVQRPHDGMMKGVSSSSLPIPPVVETKGLESEFRSISSSSHGSFIFNSQRPASSVISTKGNGGNSEPLSFHSSQSAPTEPLQFYKNPSSSHSTAYSPQITANQATRSLPFQGSTNVHATRSAVTASSNDWIPISPPNLLPVTASNSQQLSTSRPSISNGPILQNSANIFDVFTLSDGKSMEGNSNNKEKEKNIIGSTTSDNANDVVDNDSDPSFLSGFRFTNPEVQEPLYGQVVSPPQNRAPLAPARKPPTKHAQKSPHPLNINQIIAEAVESKPPMQPGIKTTKLSTKEKLKTNMHSSNKPSGNSLKGNGIGKEIHNMGNQFPYPPIKTGVDPGDASFRHLLNGPLISKLKKPVQNVQNNFDDGLRDDVGKVSSFSYFRNQGPEKPGSKGFDQAFNVHAGRNIAIQFKQHMFDQTGFPGKIE